MKYSQPLTLDGRTSGWESQNFDQNEATALLQISAHMHYSMSAEETQGGENGNSFIDY